LRWTFAFRSRYCCRTAGCGLGGAAAGTVGVAAVAMFGYQREAMRCRPGTLFFDGCGAEVSAFGSRIIRVKRSNCAAMSEAPASASGTPELSAVETVL